GQQFFVRRMVRTNGETKPRPGHPISVHTAGWIQIVGVDTTVATATVLHACDGILLDDYLEPFSAPMVAAHPTEGSSPEYANMGRITFGDNAMQNVGMGQLIGIDRGTKQGAAVGQRYLVFRDKRSLRNEGADYSMTFVENTSKIPLVEVGEILVVAVRPDESTVQVLVSKDAITSGDFIAEIR